MKILAVLMLAVGVALSLSARGQMYTAPDGAVYEFFDPTKNCDRATRMCAISYDQLARLAAANTNMGAVIDMMGKVIEAQAAEIKAPPKCASVEITEPSKAPKIVVPIDPKTLHPS